MMAKVMHFFGNTKLFCHFLLADIEKVLYIYMPFYDGMGTYFLGKWCSGVEKTIKNTVALLVSNLIFIYLQLLS
jgi:hypothetical protein